MIWISESELVINNKVYNITNPEWIKNLMKELEEKDDSSLVLTQKTEGRIICGKIVSMGAWDTTSSGEKILPERYGKVGNVVLFLHYAIEGGVDIGTIEGKKLSPDKMDKLIKLIKES